MHTKKLVSLVLVVLLTVGPVLALSPAGPTDSALSGLGEPVVPVARDEAADLVQALQRRAPDLFVRTGQDDPFQMVQELAVLAYDQLALTINTGRATAADLTPPGRNVHLHMARGDVDWDADGVPDYYTLSAGHGFGVPAGRGSHMLYLQSDFINGPIEDGSGFIIDPTTGEQLGASMEIVDLDEGRVVLNLWRDGAVHSSLTVDAVDLENTLVYRVHDDEDRHVPSPRHSQGLGFVGIERGDPVWFSAPADLGFVRLWPPYDMDADGLTNEREVLVASHPLNGASLLNNLDGDPCTWDEEPHPKDENDRDRAVCLEFGYDLTIETPDSDPMDPLENHVWDQVLIDVRATPKQQFLDSGYPIPDIKYWELWLTSEKARSHHSSNATVTNTYGGWHHNKVYHEDDCDLLPAEPPQGTPNPQEGVTHDGDGLQHEQCKFFMDPIRYGDNEANWLYHHQLARGEGRFFGFQETVLLDTTQYRDGEYHIFMYVCLENQDDCWLPFGKFRDVRDHFAVTPHVHIANKPDVQVVEMVDIDGRQDRTNADFSGLVNVTFEASHPRGHPVAWLNHSVDAWQVSDQGRLIKVGREKWMYDLLDMAVGETRQELDVTGRYDQDADRIVYDVAPCDPCRTTLTKTEERSGGGIYVLTSDSWDYPWSPRMRGGDVTIGVTARIGDGHSSEGGADQWPAPQALSWFNNRPPMVSELDGPHLEVARSEGRTDIGFSLHYRDPDGNDRVPAFVLDLADTQGNVTKVEGDCTKDVPLVPVANPPPNSDARYECTFSTPLAGTFDWTFSAHDPDWGDNTTTIVGWTPIEIVNATPSLSDAQVQPDPVESATRSDGRVMAFQVRYRDADDAPADAWIELYKGHGDNVTFFGTYPLGPAEDCVGDATTSDAATTDLCAKRYLPFGDYSVRFHAESIRPGHATYPEAGLLEFTVGSLVEVPCPACGTDEDGMDRLASAGREGVLAANDLFLDVPPLVHPGDHCLDSPPPWLPPGLGSCHPRDSDGDGYPNSQEVGRSDPDDPWSTPVDADADMVPDVLEHGPLEMNMFSVKGGRVALATEPYVTGYASLERNEGTPERFNVSLLREGEFYNLTIRPTSTGGTTTYAGLVLLDYTITETGYQLSARDHKGDLRLQLTVDRANIGTSASVARVLVPVASDQTHELRVWTAPFRVQYGGNSFSAPAGMQAEPDGTYSFWSDLDGDGEREPVSPS